MATFPTWISKRNNGNSQNLSPRQIAIKAHSLALKKLAKDDRRKKPTYTIRERLLLSKTMEKAEEVLNKKSDNSLRILSLDYDDMMPAFKKSTEIKSESITTPIIQKQESSTPIIVTEDPITTTLTKDPITTTVTEDSTVQKVDSTTLVIKNNDIWNLSDQSKTVASNNKSVSNSDQLTAVTLVVAAAAAAVAYSSLQQQNSTFASNCRSIMIPSHSFATII